MKEKSCIYCGAMFLTDELVELDGLTLCSECLSNQTVICSHCNERIWSEDNSGNSSFHLCQTCFDITTTPPVLGVTDLFTTTTPITKMTNTTNLYATIVTKTILPTTALSKITITNPPLSFMLRVGVSLGLN